MYALDTAMLGVRFKGSRLVGVSSRAFATLNRPLSARQRQQQELEQARKQQESVYSQQPAGTGGWTISGNTSVSSGGWSISSSGAASSAWGLGPQTSVDSGSANSQPDGRETESAQSSYSRSGLLVLPSVNKPADLLQAMEAHPEEALGLLLSSSSSSSASGFSFSNLSAAWEGNLTRMNGTGLSSFVGTVVYGLCNLLDRHLIGGDGHQHHQLPPALFSDLTLATTVLAVALEPSRLRSLTFDPEVQSLLFHSHLALLSLGRAIEASASVSSTTALHAQIAKAAATTTSSGSVIPLSSLRLPLDIAEACLKQHNLSMMRLQPMYDLLALTLRRGGLRYKYRQPPQETKCGYLNWLVVPISQQFLLEPQNSQRRKEVVMSSSSAPTGTNAGPSRGHSHAVLEVMGEWNMLPAAYLDNGKSKGDKEEAPSALFSSLSLAQRLKSRNLAVVENWATVLITDKERQEFLSPSIAQMIDVDRGAGGTEGQQAASSRRAPTSRSDCTTLAELLNFVCLTLAGPNAFAQDGAARNRSAGYLR